MTWKKALLPPAAIYAVIFIFISFLIGAKLATDADWVTITDYVITIFGLYLATNYAKPKNTKEGLTFGLVWLAVFVVLDILLTRPFTGWEYFSSWKTGIVYALTVLMPTILPKK